MKIYKVYGLLGLCYIYSMNPVEGELMEEVEIKLPKGYREVKRENGTRGIACPEGCVATMFSGADPTIYKYTGNNDGKYHTFKINLSKAEA